MFKELIMWSEVQIRSEKKKKPTGYKTVGSLLPLSVCQMVMHTHTQPATVLYVSAMSCPHTKAYMQLTKTAFMASCIHVRSYGQAILQTILNEDLAWIWCFVFLLLLNIGSDVLIHIGLNFPTELIVALSAVSQNGIACKTSTFPCLASILVA